jgi:hypothetical protein
MGENPIDRPKASAYIELQPAATILHPAAQISDNAERILE